MDDDTAGKDVAICDFNQQSCTHEELWTSIFQLDSIESALFVVFQTHEDSLVEALRTKKYEHGVGLMTVAKHANGKFSFVNVDSALEQRRRKRSLDANLSPTTVDGRHRHSCTRKLLSSAQPGT